MSRVKSVKDIPYEKARFLKALEGAHGMIYTACSASKVPRSNVYDWIKIDNDFAEAVKETREGAIDFTESKLFDNIKKGNIIAQMFLLKCIGKHRGWIDKTEVEHSGSAVENITVNVVANKPLAKKD